MKVIISKVVISKVILSIVTISKVIISIVVASKRIVIDALSAAEKIKLAFFRYSLFVCTLLLK
jgi:hypothetical protein